MKNPGGSNTAKALATPVLGGMVSSLLHVLIVAPVIFLWLREREFRGAAASQPSSTEGALTTSNEKDNLVQAALTSRRGLASPGALPAAAKTPAQDW